METKKHTKAKGTRFEYRVQKYFQSLGWVVYRSAGSHGFADLIMFNSWNWDHVAIQCKAFENVSISAKEKQDAEELVRCGVQILVVGRQNKNNKLQFYTIVKNKLVRLEKLPWPRKS